jgi:monofunctional chorismate mutase
MDSLKEKRILIDTIDTNIIDLLKRRFQVVSEIKTIKEKINIPVLDSGRENKILDGICLKCGNENSEHIVEIYKTIMGESKKHQKQ